METRLKIMILLLFASCVNGQLCDTAICTCQSGQCTICVSNFFFMKGSQCLICDYRCKSCTSQKNCSLLATCEPSYFYNNASLMCEACPTRCSLCNNNTVCIQCGTGYALFNSSCTPCLASNALSCDTPTTVSLCQNNFWVNGDTCMPCRQFCVQCSGPTSCSQCAPGYLKQTAAGTYCAPCIVGCMTCSTNTTCDACNLNFNLVNGSCINITNTCLATIKNCLSCSTISGLTCSVCQPLYYYLNGGCIYGASLLCQAGAVGPQPYKCSYTCQSGTYKQLTTNSNTTFSCLPSYEVNGGSIYQLYFYSSYSQSNFVPSTTVWLCYEMSIYSLSNNIILSQILSPYYKLTISAKLYPLFLINYTAALNEVLNISMTVTDNSTIPNSDSYNVTGLTFNSSCTPTYFNFSTRNINEQSITLSINPSFTNTAQNFSNGLVGLAELFIQVYRCSDDCRICANSNFCLECKQLFVSNNQCVDSCGGLFEFYIPNGDVNNFTSKACLSACPTTFYANISSAIFICLPCQSPCVTCRSNSQCSSCASPYLYYSQNFSCLMSCPLGYYSKNGSCLQCNTPCKTCSNETACTSCSIGFFDGSGCVALCSPGTFEQQLTSTCVQCSPTCLTCSINPLNCLSCPSGLALYGSTCVLACPANGYYLDNTTGNCIACRSPCLNCLSISTCLSCLTGYLQNNTCLSNCPTKYYSETSNNTCVACINNCLTCASTTICQSCLSGYYLYQSSCVITCPNLYYQIVTQSNNGLCSPCLLPCANCLSSVLCLTCQTGFLSKLQNNTCLTLCEDNYFGNFTDHTCVKCLSPCLTCTSATSCLMCLPSVTNNLLQGNTCVSVCNSGYYNQSMMCLPCLYPCITCNTTATGCLSCSQPFLLRGQDCVSQCMSGEYPFNNIQCVNCTGDCQTCTDATTCLSCVSVISGVQKYLSGSVCLAICPNKTFADSITLQCRACVFPCLTCIDILNCNTCQIGFLNVQTNRCDFCTSTEYSDTINQQCVTCNSSLNNCSTCINSTWCTSCQANFYLYSGKCISAADCNQILSYYLNIQQSACLQCVAPCQYCTSQIVCLSCLTGFLIESNQTCGHSCPIMFYADSSTKVCQPCNSTVCRTCTNTANTCLDCFNNSDATKPNTNLNFSILFNRTCINQSSCPTEYYIDFTLQTPQCLACVSPCRECTSVSVCLNCWSGILQNSTCVTNCSSGSFSIVSNGMLTCQTCDPSCLTCMNISTYCLSCQTRKFIQTGSCVTNCSNIFYYDPNTLSCLPCRSPCATCSSIINCITCLNSLYLYYGQCVQICPDGSYPDSSTNQSACLSCPSICSKCKLLNGSVVCTTCSNSKFMISTQPGQCLTACPDGWYADFGTYQCYQCQTPCVTCSAATQCTTCISGYLIYHTDCLLGNECPDGTYLQPSAPICNEVCYAPYYANPPTKTCELICSQNYLMTNNQTCVLACPTDYYIDRNMTCQNCYDSTGSYLQQCKSLLTFTIEVRSIFNKLFLQVTFTQPYGYITPDEIQVSYSKLIASRLLADQTTMAFSLQSSTDTTLTLELLPTGSITSEMIEMQLSKYIITDQFVLQNLYSTYMLNQYDLYDIPDGLDALEAFGKAICIITTLAFLAALLFNVGCVLYPLINCLQFLFLVLFCNVDFSPNLNHFLFGLRYLHFLYLPQIFSTQSSTSQSQLLRLSPNKFGSLLTDITFLGNTGPAFILLFIFIGVLLVCKLIDLLMIRPQRTVANAADTQDNATSPTPQQPKPHINSLFLRIIKVIVDRFKWNYLNDCVFLIYYYLSVFSMTQMLTFTVKSPYNYASNFFSVIFVLLIVSAPFVIYYLIKSNKQQIIQAKPKELLTIKCFYYRLSTELPISLYSMVVRYAKKLIISVLIVVVSTYPEKHNYPIYLLGLLTILSLLTIILTGLYRPYELKAEVIYHCVFETLFFLILVCLSVICLGYEIMSQSQKIVAGTTVIALTFLMFGCAIAYLVLMVLYQLFLMVNGRNILACFSKIEKESSSEVSSESSKSKKDVIVPIDCGETDTKLVVLDHSNKTDKDERVQQESSETDSDFNPYLKNNDKAPHILIKCIKNLDVAEMRSDISQNMPYVEDQSSSKTEQNKEVDQIHEITAEPLRAFNSEEPKLIRDFESIHEQSAEAKSYDQAELS